jgi:hypothetical protein
LNSISLIEKILSFITRAKAGSHSQPLKSNAMQWLERWVRKRNKDSGLIWICCVKSEVINLEFAFYFSYLLKNNLTS